MNNAALTSGQALATALKAEGVNVECEYFDTVIRGERLKGYRVMASLNHAKSGTTVAQRLQGEHDAKEVAKSLKLELKAKAKLSAEMRRAEKANR